MRTSIAITAWLAAALCSGCDGDPPRPGDGPDRESRAVSKVEIVRTGDGWALLRNGEPYAVRGAGFHDADMAVFASHGGNSFRTWHTGRTSAEGMRRLDEALAHGLTVALCLDIARERHGFDYDDGAAVAEQLERAREEVLKYKDHPALLAWIIGNELNLGFRNPKVFDAVNDISRMIHEVDGNHPTTTALAGFDAELARLVATRAPDLDFLSVQLYGNILELPRSIRESGYDGPLFVTEWGTRGHWEVPTTAWGAPIELPSSAKARHYLESYRTAIAPYPQQVLGSYVFLWGQKQERTPTWYGMFLEDGSETEAIDVMHYLWTGGWPDNRAPHVDGLLLDSRAATDDVVVEAGRAYRAEVSASDPDGDPLAWEWIVMRESTATQQGGDAEAVPETLHGLVDDHADGSATLTAPAEAGAYRLFVHVRDGHGNAGHANLPFLVRD